MTSTSYLWESTAVDPFLSFDDSNLIHLLQDTYPSQPAPKPKDSTTNSQDSTSPNRISNPNPISPPYSDSSPSPSSANEDTASLHESTRPNGDGDHKRKASIDDFEIDDEQRTSKSPTTDSRSKRTIAPSRRKSGGGERYQDETKLLKRKEQNRAAQRAFRERKEKHVKDLEDKVAQLEAKSESQATENENLRDMLNRLQSENALLRQTAFTFTLPSNSGLSNPPSSNPFSVSEPGPSRLNASSTSNTVNNRISEPQSNFNSQYSSESLSSLADNGPLTDADLDSMALFGGPFTTVASNPMFMSYRDPTQSMNAFASFGGWDDMSMLNTNSNSFGDQFSALSSLNNGDDITASLKAGSGISPYDVEFQAALKKTTTPQESEMCMIDQLCADMQRKATCTALN
ncbi:hypothetical protein Clacol_003005 [Clathrus columnatus]|uniref:BZIP domain-containing protein n=1 Tax=Clathrus columnatus TaxID=1419009 RepID=A0AAV5A6Z7_9AGAM|nr:hypothetical protein Clacol_003005 [Clathrus columnatus]